jgi:hypothetical protein
VAEIPTRFLVHRVDVEPLLGTGGYGDQYDTKVADVPCMRDDRTRLVRNSDGDEVTSQTTLYMRLSQADRFPAGSRVTLPGRVASVITSARRDDAGLGAWQHLEVVCE